MKQTRLMSKNLALCCYSGRRHYRGPHIYITGNAAAGIDEGEVRKKKDAVDA